MQPRPTPAKIKYKIKDYAASGNFAVNKCSFLPNDGSCKLYCLCNQYSILKSRKCARCNQSYHSCVVNKAENTPDWQCLRCESRFIDPIYFPQQTLLQTFFKTETIYQVGNQFQFIFYLTGEQLKNPIEIRGLQDGRSGLAWPMHGQFFLNRDQYPESIIDFKPLLKNSNRKHRKQQAIILPVDKLKLGRNILSFVIPKMNATAYEAKYQPEVRNIYFLGIYAIKKYLKEELIQKTFKTSTINKQASLLLLKNLTSVDNQLSVQKIKLCLQCPYMKSRIKIPIRGKNCKHYMVICLDTLIQTRASLNSRQWFCPICNSNINQPVIDMFILSILNDGTAGIEVMLNVNGKYQWQTFQDDDLSILSSEQNNERLKIIQREKEKERERQKQKQMEKEKEKQKEKEKEKQKKIQIQIPTKQTQPKPQPQPQSKQKNIQMINLDDDDDIPPSNPIKSIGPFEIMIPQQVQQFNKSKQINLQKQKLKQKIKAATNKKKQVINPSSVNKNTLNGGKYDPKRSVPNKFDLCIKDIRQIDFKTIKHSEYYFRYFTVDAEQSGNYQYVNSHKNLSNINQDLKIIFKEVL